MRLIDAEMIKIPTSLIHNINGCFMIRVEDVQRIISDQPTAFDKEKVIEQLHRCRVYQFQGTLPDGRVCHFSDVIEIVEKGGIE